MNLMGLNLHSHQAPLNKEGQSYFNLEKFLACGERTTDGENKDEGAGKIQISHTMCRYVIVLTETKADHEQS